MEKKKETLETFIATQESLPDAEKTPAVYQKIIAAYKALVAVSVFIASTKHLFK
jgi:hypothetical protein